MLNTLITKHPIIFLICFTICFGMLMQVVADTKDAKAYIKTMKHRDEELSKGWLQIVPPLEIETNGGKQKINQ